MYIEPNFSNFSAEDFVWNSDFRQWVLEPDADSDIFWSEWLEEHPEKGPDVQIARQMVKAIFVKNRPLTDTEIRDAINKVMQHVEPSGAAQTIPTRQLWKGFISIAASVFIISGFACWFYLHTTENAPGDYNGLVNAEKANMVEKINNTDAGMTVSLSDGSTVVLAARSRMRYPAVFAHLKMRKIYLAGQATFEVAKDPSKPFFVYANGLIVKVLGTKFNVRSYKGEGGSSVEVKSGIVSVFSYINDPGKEENNQKKLNSLILTRNQKANYSSVDKTLMATVVEKPILLADKKIRFNFSESPLSQVFKDMIHGYGIDIIYDEKLLANRTLSANLEDTSLYEKMDVICKAINARYEVIDGKIVLYLDNRMPIE